MSHLKLSLAIALCCLGAVPRVLTAGDPLARLQEESAKTKVATWGHWGPNQEKYSSWTTHSNRLVPLYIFGGNVSQVAGENSAYRSEQRLKELYGSVPEETLNANASYFDQTDVFHLQHQAIQAGKRRVLLFVFDGMDWQTTQAAAIAKLGRVAYESGRGTGLAFQDYAKAETDFGWFVSSPHNDGTSIDIDGQRVTNPGGKTPGGYCARLGGETPWSDQADAFYLLTENKQANATRHAYTDSASSATSMTCGIKTYNNAINVDFSGREALPIARILQEQGFAVGVVTSVPISHATPGCAYANNVHRNDYQDITRDMLGLPSVFHPGGLPGLDVLLGAGWGEDKDMDGEQGKNYVPGNRYLAAEDLEAIDVAHGGKYSVALRTPGRDGREVLQEATEQAIQKKSRLFGYFGVAGGHLPYQTADGGYDPVVSANGANPDPAEVYTSADIQENPVLADLTEAAIRALDAKSENWWLMVEAGDVDWANHSNNIDNSVGAVLSGESAFLRAAQWIEQHGGWEDTLLIVTADHGHFLVLDDPQALCRE